MRSGPHLALVLARRRALFAGALAASSVLVFELVARARAPAGARSILVALVHALGLGLGSALLAHATGAGPRGRGPGVLEARRAAVAALDAPTAALTFFSSGLVTAIAAHGVALGWARLEATLHTLLRAHSAGIVAFAGCLAIAGARAATRPSRSGGATFVVATALACGVAAALGGAIEPGRTAFTAAATALVTLPLLSAIEHGLRAARDATTIAALEDRSALLRPHTTEPGALAIVRSEHGALAIVDDQRGALALTTRGSRARADVELGQHDREV